MHAREREKKELSANYYNLYSYCVPFSPYCYYILILLSPHILLHTYYLILHILPS